MLFTFLTMYFIKKIDETYCCSSSIAYQERRSDGILKIFTLNDKTHYITHNVDTSVYFEGQSDQSNHFIFH